MYYNTRKSKGNINAKRTARSKENSYRLIGKSFMENVGKTVSGRDVYIAVFLRWQKNAKMPGVIAEQIVVLKNEEVLVKTKGMLGISSEKLVEQNTFSILLPADIFEREKNRSII